MKKNSKKIISLVMVVALFSNFNLYAQDLTSFEQIKKWGDGLFIYYDTARQGTDFYNNELRIIQSFPTEAYEKLDSINTLKLLNYYNIDTVDTNYYIRENRFKILNLLYVKTASEKLAQQVLEAMFLPQYYQYFSSLNEIFYTDELTSLCKKGINNFLDEKMPDSIAQKIVYYKVKYDQRFYVETLKRLYPVKYMKPADEILDSIAKSNLKENVVEYKNYVFDQTSSLDFIAHIVGDKFWKEFAPLLEKKYLRLLKGNKGGFLNSQILGVLSRFNYKEYKKEYVNSVKEYFEKTEPSSELPLCGNGIFVVDFFTNVYPENFDCIKAAIDRAYKDSSKKYLCPEMRLLPEGEKQDTMNWSNDYLERINQVFHISNPSNWKAFSSKGNSVFNKDAAEEIRNWLSQYTQTTFPFKKYNGYFKFPKSRKDDK